VPIKGSPVSIWSLDGRQAIPFRCGDRQRQLLESRCGETDLAFVRGQWSLFVVCAVETPEPFVVDDALGIDVGVVNLATDSDGESFNGNFGTSAIRLPNLSRARMLLFAHRPTFIHHDGSTVKGARR
jgi:transposase